MRPQILASIVIANLALAACDWNAPADYHPKADYQAFLQQQEAAKAANAAGGVAAVEVAGKATFETYCSACHGLTGKADGATAQALNPKPRDFTDKSWQAKVSDEHIFKIIKEGGPAVGLSPTMAPWGAAIQDPEIKNIVQYVRSLGQ